MDMFMQSYITQHVALAQRVRGLARAGDVAVGISTSGNSENVIRGLQAAKEQSAITVALLGRDGGKIASMVDHAVIVPANITSHVQEMHVLIVHLWCDI